MATRTGSAPALLLAVLMAACTLPAALAPALAQQRSTPGHDTSTGRAFGQAQGDNGPQGTPQHLLGGKHLGTLAVEGMGRSVAGHSDNNPANNHPYGKQGGH